MLDTVGNGKRVIGVRNIGQTHRQMAIVPVVREIAS